MSLFRVFLSILCPPLAVFDKGCGSIIIVFILSSIFSVFSFGGIGIREYIFLSSASILNFSPELSASIGLLFTISAAISSLPGLKFIISKPDYLK